MPAGRFLEQNAFGDLELEVFGTHAGLLQQVKDTAREGGVAQLHWRDVDREGEAWPLGSHGAGGP